MSYGVMAYAIDLDEIRAMIGSRDPQVLERCEAAFAGDVAEIDDMLAGRDIAAGDAPLPAAQDVLRHLIMGEAQDQRAGFAYAYCLKSLCNAGGQFLDNSAWEPIRSEYLTRVQSALDGAGVPRQAISIERLTFGGPPVAIPPVEDFPGVGFLDKAAVRDALDALSRVKPADIVEQDMRESIVALTGWLSLCRDKNRDLVCFYH